MAKPRLTSLSRRIAARIGDWKCSSSDSYAQEYGVAEGGIVHHVAVPGVLAVGAVDADDPGNDDLRSYSDQGPSRIYFPSFETRDKSRTRSPRTACP